MNQWYKKLSTQREYRDNKGNVLGVVDTHNAHKHGYKAFIPDQTQWYYFDTIEEAIQWVENYTKEINE